MASFCNIYVSVRVIGKLSIGKTSRRSCVIACHQNKKAANCLEKDLTIPLCRELKSAWQHVQTRTEWTSVNRRRWTFALSSCLSGSRRTKKKDGKQHKGIVKIWRYTCSFFPSCNAHSNQGFSHGRRTRCHPSWPVFPLISSMVTALHSFTRYQKSIFLHVSQ